MIRRLLLAGCLLSLPMALWAQEPEVRVEPPGLQGSRPLEKQTEAAVVRDYLESWHSLCTAMEQNNPGLLDPDFAGVARQKLTDSIVQQVASGLSTRYIDRTHDLQIVFYSPEGMSIQLIDNVAYDEQVMAHGKVLTTQQVQARYIVVLTPAEQRWRVRVFQADGASPSESAE